jgi:hypothetical protein
MALNHRFVAPAYEEERDEFDGAAVRALQAENGRLQRLLEESMYGPHTDFDACTIRDSRSLNLTYSPIGPEVDQSMKPHLPSPCLR